MNREGLNLEYKWDYVDDVKKTVIAFANTDGGKLWIGIEDDGRVAGIPDAVTVMIKESSGDYYEEIRSLSQELTFASLKKEFGGVDIKTGRAQMKSLHLVGQDDLYTNLGLLLSDQCVHTIKLAVFEGNSKDIFKDRYEFTGSLFQQIRECYALIDRYNRTRSQFDGLTRIDMRDYPPTAIREALLNAVVHRDYSYRASTLISIFDGRIEIITIGGLVKGITQGDIYLGISILRNQNLANVFYRLKLIEAFGTGIPKIMESYENCEGYIIKPKIEISDNAFKVTLYNTMEADHKAKLIKESRIYYTEGERRILDMFVSRDRIKRLDIEEALSISQPMAVKYLKNLLNKSAIEKIGDGKNVQYQLKQEYSSP